MRDAAAKGTMTTHERISLIWRELQLMVGPGRVSWGALSIIALWLMLSLVFWPMREVPYYWDGVGYVFSHSRDIRDMNLFPFLLNWDVGHPTLFFVCVAAAMLLLGAGPEAGHFVTWGFVAVLLVAIYGNARALALPKSLSRALPVVVLCFPIVFANGIQILLDLPLTAVVLAAIWFWVRRRPLGFFLIGSAATLIKLYGVLFVPALLLAAVAARLFVRDGGRWRGLGKELLWTGSPVASFGTFLLLRYWVRGPGLTIGHESGNKPIPIWEWERFRAYLPTAYDELFKASMADCLLYVTLALLIVGVAVRLFGRRRLRDTEGTGNATARAVSALICLSLAVTFAFLQSTSLCARYNLPTIVALFLLSAHSAWMVLPRVKAMLGIYGLFAVLFVLLWHPANVAWLPSAVSVAMRRPVETKMHRFENDLRFLDICRLVRWGARTIHKDAQRNGRVAAVSAEWPFWVALADARFGNYRSKSHTAPAVAWADVEIGKCPYVLIIRPTGAFSDQPPDRWVVKKLGEETRFDASAEVYYVTRRQWK